MIVADEADVVVLDVGSVAPEDDFALEDVVVEMEDLDGDGLARIFVIAEIDVAARHAVGACDGSDGLVAAIVAYPHLETVVAEEREVGESCYDISRNFASDM
jgi:hypothetical protein